MGFLHLSERFFFRVESKIQDDNWKVRYVI